MKKIEIRKTLAIVILKLIFLQLLFAFLFIGVSVISDSISDFDKGIFMSIVAYDSLTIFLLAIIQLLFTGYILLGWAQDRYIIFQNKIEHKFGIIFKKTESYQTKNVETACIDEGIVGRLFHYGSIDLHSPTLEEHIVLSNISNPSIILSLIEQNLSTSDKSKVVFMEIPH